MPQVHPIDVEAAVVKGVYELMRESIFHVLLTKVTVLAEEDTVIGREASRCRLGARVALYRRGIEWTSCAFEMLQHKHDHRACDQFEASSCLTEATHFPS